MEKEIPKRSLFFQSYGKDRSEETTREHLFYNENGDQIGTAKDMVRKLCDSELSKKEDGEMFHESFCNQLEPYNLSNK